MKPRARASDAPRDTRDGSWHREPCLVRRGNRRPLRRTVMSDFEKRAAARYGLVSKVGYQVLIGDEGFARNFAAKHGASCEKTADGWLVQKPIPADSEDDPISKLIKSEIERLG